MTEIMGFTFSNTEKLTPKIYETNGGKCWKIYAPGSSYTMLSLRTLRGAAARARKIWGDVDVRVFYLNGETALI